MSSHNIYIRTAARPTVTNPYTTTSSDQALSQTLCFLSSYSDTDIQDPSTSMPPPSDYPGLHLHVLEKEYFVKQLAVDEPIGPWLDILNGKFDCSFVSVTKTQEEISVVGEASVNSSVQADWRCIKLAGPMEFELTGVLASFTAPLKEAKIPVFAVSTWNTDYILIPNKKIDKAVQVLREDGWIFGVH